MILRPYQSRVLEDLWKWFTDHETGDPIVEASVGAGKSVMIAALCQRALAEFPGTRIVMAVHVKELLQQNAAKLRAVWPGAPLSLYSAGVGQRDVSDVTFTSIQTVHKRAAEFGRVDLMLVDECHLISPKAASMYQRFIADLRQVNPGMRVIGWTGTAFRGDGVWLTHHGLFSHVAARVTMRELLDADYLAPLRSIATGSHVSTEGVAIRQGDYALDQLEAAVDKDDLVHAACAEIVRLGVDRRKWLVFAVSIRHALHILAGLRAHGVPAAMVTGDTPPGDRDAYIRQFRSGKLRALVNVAVLTTGFDVPEVDLIALLRPTKSPVLYVQIAGRGMRTADGKTDCLWLDFTGTTSDLGPVDEIKGRVPQPKKAGGRKAEAPIKLCPECGNPSGVLAITCASCGFEFPSELKHGAAASGSAVLAADLIGRDHPITRVEYARHSKPGKPTSLRANYYAGLLQVASEWVCLEHEGYAREKATTWWARRGHAPVPSTVDEALARLEELIDPVRISVRQNGKYSEITRYEFDPTARHARGDQAGTAAPGSHYPRMHELPALPGHAVPAGQRQPTASMAGRASGL